MKALVGTGRFPFAALVALLLTLVANLAHADAVPFDYRCGSEIALARGAPVEGWKAAKDGQLPGNAGNPCWLRIDVAHIAPLVLKMNNAGGYNTVTLFDAAGKTLAVGSERGTRESAIVGSGGMLFPMLPASGGTVYARVDHDRYQVSVDAVALASEIRRERNFDFLHFGMAVLYGAIAIVAVALAIIVYRDRGQLLFGSYFAMLIVNELILTDVVLSLSTITDDVPIAVSGDVTRLRQVLLNLLSNAVKFTEKGSVALRVERGAGDELRFAVRDSGIGLGEAGIARLFQRYAQADSSTTRRYGGTGLGLAISKKLAELMGGTMTAESDGIGHGSNFKFGIRAPAATLPASRAASTATAIDPQMGERHPLRILLAEDSIVNQKLAMRLLQRMGYSAELARNGIEAIAAVERQRYDVVLMDVQMPEMDGLEASRRIVASTVRGGRPRIVAMTANAMQGDREACLAAGMDDYVSKPIRVEQLIESLNRVIARPELQDR